MLSAHPLWVPGSASRPRKDGFRRLVLDTNHALTAAHALYGGRGVQGNDALQRQSYADYWFEKRLD
jgi:hypothetical protein